MAIASSAWQDTIGCCWKGVVAYPDRRLSELPVLTATEQQQLLQDWNQTEVEYPWITVSKPI
jgi:hypothetical protein